MNISLGASPRASQIAAILGVDVSQLSNFPAFNSLAHETDTELFEDGLISLAGRLEKSGREETAARAYAEIHGEKAALAQRRLRALNGGGEIGDRAEVLVRQFGRQAFDPSTLFGMTVAGGIFRLARLSAGMTLAAQPAQLFTRGATARGLASLAAFSAEALAFPLSARLAASALSARPDLALLSLGEELKRSFLSLGALRLGGRAVQALAPNRRFLPELGMFVGAFTAHRLEERLGWRPGGSPSLAFVDSLALFAQFYAAGRIADGAMGRSWSRWTRELDLRTAKLPLFDPQGWKPLLAVHDGAGSGPRRLPVTISDMVPRSESHGSGTNPKPEPASGPAAAKNSELAEFKAEAGHLAHDIAGGLTSLAYNMPLLRSHLAELSILQAALLKHYRTGGREPPPEIVRQVDELFHTSCDGNQPEPLYLSAIERVEWRIEQIRGLVSAELSGVEMRVSEIIEMSNEFRNLSNDRSKITMARLEQALNESFLRTHLGPRVRFTASIPERMTVTGPDTTLRRIFQNLLVNTREALDNQEFPLVRITGRSTHLTSERLSELQQPEYGFDPAAEHFWILRIQDNGSGIPAKALPRIFESGFSTKSSSFAFDSVDLQRGLGLAQVHKAVKARGGFVRVSSQLGQGTAFEVYLPDMTY